MKYQNLLFSRSFNQDYRWILTPSFLSSSDLDKLERLIWSDEGRRYLEGLSLRPTFLIRLPNAYALCRFYRTNFTDSRKRPIDCIDGIAISLADSWFLRFALAWLLTDQTHILDSWKKLDFDKVDSYTRKVPETQEFDLNSLTEKNSMLFDGRTPIKKEFPFSQSGFEKLVSYLYPSPNIEDLELLEFAYGVSPSMVSRYQSFDIVTPLDSKASFTSQIEKPNYQIPSKPAISAYQKSSVHLPPSSSKSSVPTSSEFDEKVRKLREGGSQNQIVSPPPPKKRKPSLFERLFWGIHDDDE